MISTEPRQNGDEARLWVAALLISVVLNAGLLGWVSYEAILSKIDREKILPESKTKTVVTLFPEMFVEEVEDEKENETADKNKQKSVRTSDDQLSPEAPKSRRYIGERNTQATSDRTATNDDKSMPSQAGREPLPIEAPETTESVYQDGRLDTPLQPAVPNPLVPLAGDLPEPPSPSAEKMKGETQPDPGEAEIAETAIREKLLDGPNVVEKEVPKAEVKENIKPREEKKTQDGDPQGLAVKKPDEQIKRSTQPATAAAANDPAFSGNQSKTAIRGSISRTGRSALDVVDTPMGRYHAQISRAVELEWQRNCVRRRDFIVPGYLTVRFFIDAEGRVSNLSLGDIEGGEIQKGFTIDSIRDAEIPPMPSDVKKEMGDDSLELIYNFIF